MKDELPLLTFTTSGPTLSDPPMREKEPLRDLSLVIFQAEAPLTLSFSPPLLLFFFLGMGSSSGKKQVLSLLRIADGVMWCPAGRTVSRLGPLF